jgi:ribosomal protein S4
MQKLRQSMNKFNLYNIAQFRNVRGKNQTYFAQKWYAKAHTRAYHGEQVKERAWRSMFRPRLQSVVPMSPEYLARCDGSEQAEGRGSGRQLTGQGDEKRKQTPIPHMNMTYAPLERRLDTAVFRALFASSARQARQFVIHGFVKVNGKKVS